MSKTNRRRRAERRRPAWRTTRAREHTAAEPDLLADVRRALADPNPLSLLTYVSTLLCVTDPRRDHPFARHDAPDPEALTREGLVQTFLDLRIADRCAPGRDRRDGGWRDDVLVAETTNWQATEGRTSMACTAVGDVNLSGVQMSHVLSDGDNIMLGVRLPGGRELACLVYIDHNLGTLVKDAFVKPRRSQTWWPNSGG